MQYLSDRQTGAPAAAYLFPGQGSQEVGMGHDLHRASPAARAVFDEVDDALDVALSRLIFEGPQAELTKTINAQPAILATSLAYLAAVAEATGGNSPRPQLLAGHSLGEYTALVAAGSLSIVDAARLVRERGRLMQDAAERRIGGMVAIMGLDELTLEEVCRETGAQIANINSDDQIVISGDRFSLAWAVDLASIRGARRAVPLPVAGAFHSRLMQPALKGMTEAVASVPLREPRVPIVANTSAELLTTAAAIRAELVRQLCHCVQWRRSVDYMLNTGVKLFYEIGPGRVLSGLMRRIDPEAQVVSVGSLEAVHALAG
jgi:[acyl-carrier-protein] S-malonyltransferase